MVGVKMSAVSSPSSVPSVAPGAGPPGPCGLRKGGGAVGRLGGLFRTVRSCSGCARFSKEAR